jgi:hypothetical protein
MGAIGRFFLVTPLDCHSTMFINVKAACFKINLIYHISTHERFLLHVCKALHFCHVCLQYVPWVCVLNDALLTNFLLTKQHIYGEQILQQIVHQYFLKTIELSREILNEAPGIGRKVFYTQENWFLIDYEVFKFVIATPTPSMSY